MKRLFIAGLFILGSFFSYAQKDIKVVSKNCTVAKIPRKGIATTVELDNKYVKDLWKKHIKDYGKVSSKGKISTIELANMSSISSTPVTMYSQVESSGKGTEIWMGIDMGDKYVVEGGEGYSSAQELLKSFALSCYKEDLMDQVKEAEDALGSSVKKQEKVIKEGEKLVSSIESNKKEKEKLEQAIAKNANDKIQLESDLEQNKKDQGASKDEVEKMKKALEIKQAELNQIK